MVMQTLLRWLPFTASDIAKQLFRLSSGCQFGCPAVTALKQINAEVAKNRSRTDEEGFFWKFGYDSISVPGLTVDEYVWRNIANWPDGVAIECGLTGHRYTYRQLREHSSAVAVTLQKKFKLKLNDIIAIALPNMPDYGLISLGAIEAGLIITTINPNCTTDEIVRMFHDTKPKMIFFLNSAVLKFVDILRVAQLKSILVAVKMDRSQPLKMPNAIIDFDEIMDVEYIRCNKLTPRTHVPSDICYLPFSSGTTGLPKGVMLSHTNIVANCEMMGVKFPYDKLALPSTKCYQDVIPSVLPFFHSYGFTATLISRLALGCKIVTLPKFDSETILHTFTHFTTNKNVILCAVPGMIQFLGHDNRVTADHLQNIRTIICGGAPIGIEDVNRFKEKAQNTEFIQCYGMTETSPLSFIAHKGKTDYSTIGWPVSLTDAKVAKADDPKYLGVDADVEGELLVRGPSVMKGYRNNEKATGEIFVGNGWLRTGDLAYYDVNGFFYIKGRLKELIKVKGYHVAPAELEQILREHPKIVDSAVMGVPHDKYGEVPRAFVVRKRDIDLTEQELMDYMGTKLVDYKQLRGGIKFVAAIPWSYTGKIIRSELKSL